MSALTKERGQKPFFIKKIRLPIGANMKAYKGAIACFDSSAAGYVVQGKASTTLTRIGVFAETVDNTGGSAGALLVNVELDREIMGQWFANDAGTAVVAANIGTDVYILDDHTVTGDSTGHSKAGRCWKVDSQLGVAVELLGVT
jgi:hypothetical protein